MSDIVDLLDSSNDKTDSLNFNVDDDSDESNETPFQRLIRLQNSNSNYNERKNAVKYILDALRFVNDLQSLYEILSSTKKLADDIVTQVQIDCLEKFISIIEYLIGNVQNADILIKDYLFQSIIQTIGHGNNRIRKASQSSLIRLFELEQIQNEQIEEEIIPVLCQLDRASDDFKNESILLMTRLTGYISNDLVFKYFLPTIVEQSSSIAFQTRKTCATSIGDLASVISSSAVDQYLIPCLANLCSDPFWGVRKSCAEVIHPLAEVCSKESRWNILSPCLIQLFQDQSRWVKTAALRVLGYFISTFAQRDEKQIKEDQEEEQEQNISQNENTYQLFNQFRFWRQDILINEEIEQEMKDNLFEQSKFNENEVNGILPIELLEYYRSIVEQSYSNGVESDIVHQSAHTFPAVLLTLTNRNWHLIKDLHRKFAEDLQWKVRRTLAYSLHVLAQMLTIEQVEEDLCPIFNSFFRDVDEVKIGILSHLFQFLEVLQLSQRRIYLEKLTDLTSLDNQRNWRFRWECANQFYHLVQLFSSEDVSTFLTPLVFTLAIDQVSDVRQSAIKSLCGCYLKFVLDNQIELIEIFVNDCHRIFALSKDWKFRQCYISLCSILSQMDSLNFEDYSLRFLPNLFLLKEDPVVNVRLSLGTFLYHHEFFIHLSSEWQKAIEDLIELFLIDTDRDVRLAVGGIEQSSQTSLTNENLDQHSDNSFH